MTTIKDSSIHFRIPHTLRKAIRSLATVRNQTESAMVRDLVTAGLVISAEHQVLIDEIASMQVLTKTQLAPLSVDGLVTLKDALLERGFEIDPVVAMANSELEPFPVPDVFERSKKRGGK